MQHRMALFYKHAEKSQHLAKPSVVMFALISISMECLIQYESLELCLCDSMLNGNWVGFSSLPLLLPAVEEGIFNDNWRIRQSSVELLGDLLFKVCKSSFC